MRTEPLIRPEEIRDDPAPTSPVAGPRRRMAVALGIVIALLVAAIGVAIWQAAEASQRADELATLTVARDEAVARATALSDRVGALDVRVDRLSDRLAAATGGEAELEARLDEALTRLEQMLGPALPDGGHFAFLTAVGASQEPPRLVIDVAQWFTDDEAVEAAIEDGRLPPGSTSIENGYYIRNADPRWRMLPVAPTATVALVVYPFGDIGDPHVVSFARFGELFAENPHSAIRGFPYWVTVEDGTVTGVEQQFIP